MRDLLAAIGGYTLLAFVVIGLVLRLSRRAVRQSTTSTDPWQRLFDQRRPPVLEQDWN